MTDTAQFETMSIAKKRELVCLANHGSIKVETFDDNGSMVSFTVGNQSLSFYNPNPTKEESGMDEEKARQILAEE